MQLHSTPVATKLKRSQQSSGKLAQETRSKVPLGKKLRTIREGKGTGLRQLAARVGLSPSYLSNIERGKFAPPAEDKLRALARELDQDPDQLLVVPGNHDP